MFQQLVFDRHEYHQTFLNLLQDFSLKLSSLITYMPPAAVPTWETSSGSKYSDAQIQTEEDTEVAKPELPYYYSPEPVKKKTNKKKKTASVKFGHNEASVGPDGSELFASESDVESENSSYENVDTRTLSEKADERIEDLCQTIKQASTSVKTLQDASVIGDLGLVRNMLDDFAASVTTVSLGDRANVHKLGVKHKQKELFDNVKKEIRSFKGSFLSARNFPPVKR